MPSHEACCGTMFWVYLMSGLTLGLMSLSLVDLEVLSKAGTPRDNRNAARILPVVKNQHLLLCTLLIGNSLAMEALPIFLDTLVPPYVAILISVTLILAFGEIIPQAICPRYGLSVGAKAVPVVRVLLILFFPVAYPISKITEKGKVPSRFAHTPSSSPYARPRRHPRPAFSHAAASSPSVPRSRAATTRTEKEKVH